MSDLFDLFFPVLNETLGIVFCFSLFSVWWGLALFALRSIIL